MKKCIVIPDSFKGTLSAIEICDITREQLALHCPGCETVCVPVADGGEGTVDCFLYALPSFRQVAVASTGPYGQPLRAYYARQGDTAVLEMAMFAGLPQVEGRQNPATTTTYGLGVAVLAAIADGCTQIVIGLGGSCTTDGGCGMAAALGTRFYNAAGESFVPVGETMCQIERIDTADTKKLLQSITITAMCDVENPLHGAMGAAHIFAPQKGADAAMVQQLDAGLVHLAAAIARDLKLDVANIPGTGAAGGMGAGILAFLGGSLKNGIATVLDLIGFEALLEGADLVLTGEGRIDHQSLNGKVISGIAQRSKAKNVPVVCVVGSIGEGVAPAYDLGVSAIFSINQTAEAFDTARFKSRENLTATLQNLLRFANVFAD